MRLLITGHRGFIGSHAVEYFSHHHDVDVWDWREHRGEINLKNVDWVIHLGAISSTTENDIDKIFLQNYDFSCELLDKCIDHQVNFQYASSASVYGRTTHFSEQGPVDPQSPYAWSKYLFERYAQKKTALAGFCGIRIQGFRYFNVCGDRDDHKDQPNPWTVFRKQAREKRIIEIFDTTPPPSRDFISVQDVLEIQSKFLEIAESGVWNIGSGTSRTFESIANEVAAETGSQISKVPLPTKLKNQYQYHTCADLTKLNATLTRHGTHRTT